MFEEVADRIEPGPALDRRLRSDNRPRTARRRMTAVSEARYDTMALVVCVYQYTVCPEKVLLTCPSEPGTGRRLTFEDVAASGSVLWGIVACGIDEFRLESQRSVRSINLTQGKPASGPRIYFARAIDGIVAEQIVPLAKIAAAEVSEQGLFLVDPILFEPTRSDSESQNSRWHHDIVVHDLKILQSCAGVLMDMTVPGRNYIGCSCELVYAYMWKIPVAVYMGENDRDRPWLQYHASTVVRTRTEAIGYLKASIVR